jgi:hypothetical protein
MLFLAREDEKLFEKVVHNVEIEEKFLESKNKIKESLNKINDYDGKLKFLQNILFFVSTTNNELIENKKGQYETTNLDIDQRNKQVNHLC